MYITGLRSCKSIYSWLSLLSLQPSTGLKDPEKKKTEPTTGRIEGEAEHAGTELWHHTCRKWHHRILRKTWSAQRQPRSRAATQTCRRASDSRISELLSPSLVFVTCPLSDRAFSRSTILAWQLLSSTCSCSRVCGREDEPFCIEVGLQRNIKPTHLQKSEYSLVTSGV